MVDDELREPVVCSDCDEQPELYYDPLSSEPYNLRCGCDVTSVDVTDALEETSLITEITGKWSNFDHNSEMQV